MHQSKKINRVFAINYWIYVLYIKRMVNVSSIINYYFYLFIYQKKIFIYLNIRFIMMFTYFRDC